MAHYNHEQWRLYKQGRLDGQRRRLMENHLFRCTTCLETYVGVMEKHEPALAELLLTPDFNDRVVRSAHAGINRQWKTRRSRLLANYTAAASLTLALMAGGAFDAVAVKLPLLLEETWVVSQAIHETSTQGWPDQLLEMATDRLGRLWKTKEDCR